MGVLGDLFDSALEGYVRGANPRYAAEQDTREYARAFDQANDRLASITGGQRPPTQLEHARELIRSANPKLASIGLDMTQQYHKDKTSTIKDFEYFNTLPSDKQSEWLRNNGIVAKPIGGALKLLDSNGNLVEAIPIHHPDGTVTTKVIGYVGQNNEFVNVGGVEELHNPSQSVPGASARAGAYIPTHGQGGAPQITGGPVQGSTPGVGYPTGQGANVPQEQAGGAPQGSNIGVPQGTAPQDAGDFNARQRRQAALNKNQLAYEATKGERRADSEADLAASRNTDIKKFMNLENNTNNILGQIDRLNAYAQENPEAFGVTSTERGEYLQNITWAGKLGGSPERVVQSITSTIKSSLAFRQLEELKNQGETGASGLGPIAIKEFEALQNSIAALDPAMPYEQFMESMNTIAAHLERATYLEKISTMVKHGQLEPYDMKAMFTNPEGLTDAILEQYGDRIPFTGKYTDGFPIMDATEVNTQANEKSNFERLYKGTVLGGITKTLAPGLDARINDYWDQADQGKDTGIVRPQIRDAAGVVKDNVTDAASAISDASQIASQTNANTANTVRRTADSLKFAPGVARNSVTQGVESIVAAVDNLDLQTTAINSAGKLLEAISDISVSSGKYVPEAKLKAKVKEYFEKGTVGGEKVRAQSTSPVTDFGISSIEDYVGQLASGTPEPYTAAPGVGFSPDRNVTYDKFGVKVTEGQNVNSLSNLPFDMKINGRQVTKEDLAEVIKKILQIDD